MNLLALPAFSDNYIWMLHDGGQALVVDPGDAAPVLAALHDHGLTLTTILVTHHHPDHTGGVARLREATGAAVFGPARESIPEPFVALRDGAQVPALGIAWEVIDVPGHTAGHIAYFGRVAGEAPIVFCGDTLFSAGCGRLFEGTPAQMQASLDRLSALPGHTRVCCAHEYTMSNLRFALAVEPANEALAAHAKHCAALRAGNQPTLPSTIEMERRINPFLRAREPAVRAAAQQRGAAEQDDVAVFAAIRQWKNEFK